MILPLQHRLKLQLIPSSVASYLSSCSCYSKIILKFKQWYTSRKNSFRGHIYLSKFLVFRSWFPRKKTLKERIRTPEMSMNKLEKFLVQILITAITFYFIYSYLLVSTFTVSHSQKEKKISVISVTRVHRL